MRDYQFHTAVLLISSLLAACLPGGESIQNPPLSSPTPDAIPMTASPIPTRQIYQPGELVSYTVQDGDHLKALAARFNTTIDEIQKANPVLPTETTTLPPGLELKIPIYYLPLWGSSYQILPDSLFPNGPAQIGFSPQDFLGAKDGWLTQYSTYAFGGWRSGADLIENVALNYSISPRLLIGVMEYQAGAVSQQEYPEVLQGYILGHRSEMDQGVYLQILWAADTLNQGYYGWRNGTLLSVELSDGSLIRFDPWQNAASVALQYYFSKVLTPAQYHQSISGDGFAETYSRLFGDPWAEASILIPGSLSQPGFILPFPSGKSWSYTGAPHPAWGDGEPWAAIDFAPPAEKGGCGMSAEWAAAVADGIVSRSELGLITLDLDGDGDERTGWVVLYLHLAGEDSVPIGKSLKAGDVVGHPSCERGKATGTHIHIARKYNGEWIPAAGAIPFTMDGWIAHSDGIPYKGTLQRFGDTVTACVCGDAGSQVSR